MLFIGIVLTSTGQLTICVHADMTFKSDSIYYILNTNTILTACLNKYLHTAFCGRDARDTICNGQT